MLSVLITTKGRKSLLAQTLNAVFHQTNHREAVAEVIIINDGDDDFSDLAAQYPVSVYKNRGRGLAAGRNTGAFYATTNNLLFYDDDILPTPDHFVRHLEIRNKFPQALITGNRFYPQQIIEEARKTPFGRYKLNHEYNWLEGCDLKKIEGEEGLFYSILQDSVARYLKTSGRS
jgi:glycosyltransferase involved in cell wall biosynthesis